jgi:bifunctional non-homologous end joining protein LigD
MDETPTGKDWLHETKYDGYHMHARIDGGQARLLSHMGLNALKS